jgi:hypothetical protein
MREGLLLWLVVAAAVAGAGADDSLSLEHRLLLLTTVEYQKWATSFIEKVALGGRRACEPHARRSGPPHRMFAPLPPPGARNIGYGAPLSAAAAPWFRHSHINTAPLLAAQATARR